MVDFDHRRPISASISRGRKKKRENLESRAALPIPSLARSVVRGRFLLPARGEEASPCVSLLPYLAELDMLVWYDLANLALIMYRKPLGEGEAGRKKRKKKKKWKKEEDETYEHLTGGSHASDE
ncbi:hypothetical protein BHM03_00029349 [Ensete ventricosum]|uniref:Uncharacterized protein n=2 Tax=Ensete ventricosum TaxID=4639 RepID=A0A445MI70_ENSVE|nr:hypothetical protein BHM03_00029349 [Ensete ventricosum]